MSPFLYAGHEDVIMDDGYMGDSNDGVMTRAAAYLFEQMRRRNDGCKYSFRCESPAKLASHCSIACDCSCSCRKRGV
jgi:hypothetical protein